MFCEKCGSEIPDIARFCPKCGAPVQELSAKPDETKETSAGAKESPDEAKEMTTGSRETPSVAQEKSHENRGRRILITLIIIAAAVVVLLLLFLRFDLAGRIAGEKTVDLDDYITVEFVGYDGNGTADVTFDIEALGDDFDSEIRLSGSAEGDYQSFSEVVADNAYLIIDPETGLSDGDEVTVTWEVDSESIESCVRGKVELLGAEIDYTVSGLTSEENFDADAGDYAVEGFASYVSSLDEIPDEAMAEMKEYAEKVKTDKADSWPQDEHTMNSLDYVGCYFLYEDPDTDRNDVNIIYLVYKLNVTKFGKNEDGGEENTTFDYYWYAGYTNGMILEDGSFFIDYEDFTEPEFGPTSSFGIVTYDYTQDDPDDQEIQTDYRGYKDLESLYEDLIEPLLDSYTCESTVLE